MDFTFRVLYVRVATRLRATAHPLTLFFYVMLCSVQTTRARAQSPALPDEPGDADRHRPVVHHQREDFERTRDAVRGFRRGRPSFRRDLEGFLLVSGFWRVAGTRE